MPNQTDTGDRDAVGLGSHASSPAAPLDNTATLARNVVHFVRVLRGAGLPMSPAQAVDALAALHWIDLGRRDDVRSALAALLVSAPDERDLFNAAFELFWRDPDWEGKLRALLLPKVREGLPPPKRNNRLADALAVRVPPSSPGRAPQETERHELHAHVTFSAEERLRHRDFDTLSADEWRTLRHLIRGQRLPLATEPTRRLKAASHGTHADLRASARHAVRAGGDWTVWKYRAVVERKPPLVLLLDISGSMSNYSRAVLYFCHALLQSRERLQVFLFGTRLTNATRALRERDPDVAIATLADQVVDWSGGTRIGAALAEFNRRWARRVLTGRATVLLVTDGLDHEAIDVLDTEMARLRRFAHRIVWLNPLLRFSGFSPKARGVQAILPYVDAHRPVHNLDSLAAFGRALVQLTRAPRPTFASKTTAGATSWN
ncbi:putative carbon monoxide dehydrogenase, CoxE subunit [Paraburkholderia ribeironis]|uniref:Putative carbon monoxide dehydrogenase, CoxE subunit n=1 Tax=Paraburkholderia ribeironis TaxID=1247936 RepID=A0A1N7RJJ3_9BURK|nr:VWA domain-containing protein [Paraburkholderia ribeironis]SIT35224.1 putative carbon monoxide dehydrogenase, CoxE subunit [Paraburkholderia ribeironis]